MQCLSNVTETPLQAAPVVALPSAQRGGLGKYAKSASPPLSPEEKKRALRSDRYMYLGVARDLLISEGRKAGLAHPHDFAKTAKCLHVRRDRRVDVYQSKEHRTAFYGGLITCGSVWACPVCAAKVQERRRVELAQGVEWAWAAGLQPIMVTLTAPHYKSQSLKELRQMQAAALKHLRSNAGGQKLRERLGFEGLIRALEVTYGQSGWHLHTHELWFVGRDIEADSAKALILDRWRSACAKVGLLDLDNSAQVRAFDLHSVDVKGKCVISDYLVKMDKQTHWGVDREMAKATSKAGRRSGLHPFGLLAEAAEGDVKAGRLFVEYVCGMKGQRQLYWSEGLKERAGIVDLSDEDTAAKLEDKADVLGGMEAAQWDLVLQHKARARLLDAAEAQGWEGVLGLLKSLATPASLPLSQSSSGAMPPAGEPECPLPEMPQPGCEVPPVVPVVLPPDHHDLACAVWTEWLADAAWYVDVESGELHARARADIPEIVPEPEPVPI
jgi:hypothetical protein